SRVAPPLSARCAAAFRRLLARARTVRAERIATSGGTPFCRKKCRVARWASPAKAGSGGKLKISFSRRAAVTRAPGNARHLRAALAGLSTSRRAGGRWRGRPSEWARTGLYAGLCRLALLSGDTYILPTARTEGEDCR